MPADTPEKVFGIIPASGKATRLGPLPCSKEIYPLLAGSSDQTHPFQPRVLSHHLLHSFGRAGINDIFFLIRHDKWDIPKYFAQHPLPGMNLAYTIIDRTPAVTYTIDQVYPFVKDAWVALGFPDILFEPVDAFERMRHQQAKSGADVVLGLFPIKRREKWDMVRIEQGKITDILVKPGKTDLVYGWTLALWNPLFSRYMHEFVADFDFEKADYELYPGTIFRHALQSVACSIDYVVFEDGWCRDLGTHDDLNEAIKGGV